MNKIKERWSDKERKQAVSALIAADHSAFPFGITSAGKMDLRGLELTNPVTLKNISLSNVDVSEPCLAVLLIINCNLSGWIFDRSIIELRCSSDAFRDSSFSESNLGSSICLNGTRFYECEFIDTDISNTSLKDGLFASCKLEFRRAKGCEFGKSIFENTSISGLIEKSFFRGSFNNCDLSNALFSDCAFYGAIFNDCSLAEGSFVFDDMQIATQKMKDMIGAENIPDAEKKKIRSWISFWDTSKDLIKNEFIDEKGLRLSMGDSFGSFLQFPKSS